MILTKIQRKNLTKGVPPKKNKRWAELSKVSYSKFTLILKGQYGLSNEHLQKIIEGKKLLMAEVEKEQQLLTEQIKAA